MVDPVISGLARLEGKALWNSDFRKDHIIKTNKEKEEEQAKRRALETQRRVLETQRKVDQIHAVVKIVCIGSLIVGVIMFLLHLRRLKRCKEKEATLVTTNNRRCQL